MGFLLLLPLIIVPLAEIAVFVQVANAIGLAPALLALLASAVLGVGLIRSQGPATLARARAALDRRELPVRELFDGACILIGGGMLLVPGFLSDVLGLLLLLPPVRGLLRVALLRWIGTRATVLGGSDRGGGSTPGVIDVDFEVVHDPAKADRQIADRPNRNDPGSHPGERP